MGRSYALALCRLWILRNGLDPAIDGGESLSSICSLVVLGRDSISRTFFFENSRPLETGLEELATGNLTKTDITRLLTKKFNNASWFLVTASTAGLLATLKHTETIY